MKVEDVPIAPIKPPTNAPEDVALSLPLPPPGFVLSFPDGVSEAVVRTWVVDSTATLMVVVKTSVVVSGIRVVVVKTSDVISEVVKTSDVVSGMRVVVDILLVDNVLEVGVVWRDDLRLEVVVKMTVELVERS